MTCDRYRKAFVNCLLEKVEANTQDAKNSETFEEYCSKVLKNKDFVDALSRLYGNDLIEELNENLRLAAFYNDVRKGM